MPQRRFPARDSSIRRSSRGSATSSCSRARSSTASSTACTARRTSARRSTSPSTAATSPGDDIRRVDWRLYARTDRYYVKQYEADTNTNFSILLDVSKSMEFASRGVTKLEYAIAILGGLPGLPGAPPARPRRHHHLRQRHRHARAAVGEALRRRAAHARSRDGRSGPGNLAAPLHKMAEHFGRRGLLVLDLRFLRGAGRGARGDQAAALPRQRSDRLPRARSRPSSTSASTTRRASRTSRAASRCRSCPSRCAREYRQLIQAHIDALHDEVLRAPHRLHAAQHGRAARPRAVQLSLERASG